MKNLIKKSLVVSVIALLFFTFNFSMVDGNTINEERLLNLYEKTIFLLDIVEKEEQKGLDVDLRRIKERLEEILERYQIIIPSPTKSASGSLSCHSSGSNNIILNYAITAGSSPVTLFRNNDIKVESWSANNYHKGTQVDSNLLPSYSYNYCLRDGTNPSSPRIAHVSCVTEKATMPAPQITLSVNNISREEITLQRGSTATVTWIATHADSCTLSGHASGSGTSGTRTFRNFSPPNTHFTVSCNGRGGTSRERILVETIDFPDDIEPIKELTYDIDSVSGLKVSYSPGEKIELTIKASETTGRVSDERGFNIGVRIFELGSNELVESTVMGSRDVVYNPRTNSWSATLHAPTNPHSYRVKVVLWCSRSDSYCYETYDAERGQAPQIEKEFYILVAR